MPNDGSRVQLSYVRETTAGTTPNSALQEILLAGGGTLAQQMETIRSNQQRSDGQRGAAKPTGVSNPLSLNVEFSPESLDPLLRDLVRSTNDWQGVDIDDQDGVTVTLDTTAKTATFTAASGTPFMAVAANQWIYIDGFAGAAAVNNGWWKVKSKNSNNLAFTVEDPGGTAAAAAAVNNLVIKGEYLRNGNAKPSMSWQEEFLDLETTSPAAKRLHTAVGARPSGFTLDVPLGGIMTGSISFQGQALSQSTTRLGDGSVTKAPGREVLAEVDNFDAIWVDFEEADWDATGFSLAGETPTRAQRKLGDIKALDIALGPLGISGSLSMFVDTDSWTVMTKYINREKFNLAMAVAAADGYRYLFEFPRILLSNEAGEIPGLDADKQYQFDFEAEPGEDFQHTIQVVRAPD